VNSLAASIALKTSEKKKARFEGGPKSAAYWNFWMPRRCTGLSMPVRRSFLLDATTRSVIAGDDERSAAALPLLSQHGFGDRVRSSDSNGTGA
jgi:hypothetical protein